MKQAFETWKKDPPRFVRNVFGVRPDPWQDEVLAAFPTAPRLAMKACKGPGKTTVQAWLAWNFLLTRDDPKVAATSVSGDNLADNLWAEMAKWQAKSPLLTDRFEWTKTRIFSRERPETWWMSARTWARSADKARLGQTLAGLHSDYILFILDESGGIPDAVMASAEAALASCKEGHIVQAGNPTHLEGPLWRACTSERRLWHVT
jgi:phage terminase large subunit